MCHILLTKYSHFSTCSFCVVVDIIRDEEFSNRLNNRSNFRGCTSLHYAVLMDSEVLVRMLLEAGQCYWRMLILTVETVTYYN